MLLQLFLPKIGIEYPHKTHIDTHTYTSAHVHEGARTGAHTNARGATDSSETAADSSQSHEASLQLMWLIHKKRKSDGGKPLSMQLLSGRLHIVPASRGQREAQLEACLPTRDTRKKTFLYTVSILS